MHNYFFLCVYYNSLHSWFQGSYWTWITPTQHEQTRWPDLKQNLGNPFYTSLRKLDSHIKHNSLTSTIPCLHVGCYPSQPVSVLWPAPTLMTFLMAQANFKRTFSCLNTLTILKPSYSSYLTCLWRWNRQCVPKRRHIKFRRRGITQKKTYNIQNSLHVSSNTMLIIRRINCINTTSGIRHSVWVIIWYASQVVPAWLAYQTVTYSKICTEVCVMDIESYR
jgi:hypothetical protein